MQYFPLIVIEQDQMLVEMIRQFVDREIMPVRGKFDGDTDHVITNETPGNYPTRVSSGSNTTTGHPWSPPALCLRCICPNRIIKR